MLPLKQGHLQTPNSGGACRLKYIYQYGNLGAWSTFGGACALKQPLGWTQSTLAVIVVASYGALGHVPPPLELVYVHNLEISIYTYLQWAMVDW